ncbi:hypothetical protein TNCV_601291 [Trichonephila clavipes]|nr:hypothetical protein TNCV_601291 [Trichonephila clavipes]
MANLPTDMELELALSQRSETRSPSPQSQLTPCEQLKYNKAQLAKMETFRKCKQACVDAQKQMPDHYPRGAILRSSAHGAARDRRNHLHGAQNQLPAPIMLFIDEELSYKAQMAAISKEFPKIRSRLTGEYLKLYTDTAEERRSAVQLLKIKIPILHLQVKSRTPHKGSHKRHPP